MKRALFSHILLVIATSGCGDTQESQFAVGLQGRIDVIRPLITVEASAPGWEVQLEGSQIRSEAADNFSEVYRTPGRGNLQVVARLQSPDGEEIALGSTALDLRRDWIWTVDIWLWDGNPGETCMGCMGVAAFPVPEGLIPEVTDSLFLVWGGNSISNPVVY